MDDAAAPAPDVHAERPRLVALAYRMLGSVAEAEDAVQETYVRWLRLTDEERRGIREPAAWLTRVAGRVCLDALGSARARRERYVGPWLPEPVPARALGAAGPMLDAADPLDRVTLDESVSTALLVVLEAMTPAERVAFVLHEVFAMPHAEIAEVVGRSPAAVRQLAASARRRIAAGRSLPVRLDEHDAAVRAFGAAAQGGDLAALMAVLDPEVTLRSDGGGIVSAARRPVQGPSHVARFVLGVLAKRTLTTVHERDLADGLGFELREHGAVVGVISFGARAGRIVDVWMVLNPEKLAHWQTR